MPPCPNLQSHKLAGHLSELTRMMKGQLLVNTDRYCFQLETLAKLLRKGHPVRVGLHGASRCGSHSFWRTCDFAAMSATYLLTL